MEQQVKTDNELIAEFMKLPKVKLGRYEHLPIEVVRDIDGSAREVRYYLPDQMQYDTSWDWLMPVVEKINNTIHPTLNERIDVIIYRRTCHINDMQEIIIETTGKDMLDCTYKAVVEFIKWYNSIS